MVEGESYRGFIITLKTRAGRGWTAVIGSGDPNLLDLIGDGGTATTEGTNRQDARIQARRFIDTLLEPHAGQNECFRLGQIWVGDDGVEGEVVETRLNGLEAKLRVEGVTGDWLAFDPEDGAWTLRR